MAPAYQNISSGQLVVSDERRPDLERLARWAEVPVPDESEREAVEIVADDPNGQPVEILGEVVNDDESATAGEIVNVDGTTVPTGEDGIPVLTAAVEETVTEVPVPDESWTHERLDEFAAARDIKFAANTNKAAKVAALTASAAE